MTIADQLRKFRLEHNLSYRALAEATKVSLSTLWALENGKREPYPRTEHKLLAHIESEQLP